MRGDLHTLKRVCEYGSKVMFVAEFVLPVVAVMTVAMAVASTFSDAVEEAFMFWMPLGVSEAPIYKISATAKMVLIWLIGAITVKGIHDIMRDVCNEHSPFTEKNTKRMIDISLIYLGVAFVFLILDLIIGSSPILTVFVFLGCILISVVMYCLGLMCRYGSLLQKESDETL